MTKVKEKPAPNVRKDLEYLETREDLHNRMVRRLLMDRGKDLPAKDVAAQEAICNIILSGKREWSRLESKLEIRPYTKGDLKLQDFITEKWATCNVD